MQNQVVVNGVVTRNVDYGGTFSNFIGAALSGLPVRIVMSAMDGSDHYLVTSPNVKRVEDLKGKTFGISSFGGTPHSESDHDLAQVRHESRKGRDFSADRRQLEPLYRAGKRLRSRPPCWCRRLTTSPSSTAFIRLLSFNEVMNIPLGGLAVHTQKMKEKPDEIVKTIKAVLKGDGLHSHAQAGHLVIH